MPGYVALLRAVNVGGTGKLPMAELLRICEDAGFGDVRTYIASGNAVFTSRLGAAKVKGALEQRLAAHAGRHVGVIVRTATEMAEVHERNPFPEDAPNRVVAIFLDAPPARDALANVRGQRDERIALGRREIYVAYGNGMAGSKLRLPAAEIGTARNMNTVAKLATMARSPGAAR